MLDHTKLSLLAFAVVCGCARPASRDEVMGTYVMNKGNAADTLVIRPSGTYVHRYAAPGHDVVVDSGQWTWDKVGTDDILTFEKFIPRYRSELSRSVPAAPGFWPARPERTAHGTVRIPVEPDLDWAFVRLRR